MKKLLVPLDGSETGEGAIPWARFLAGKEGETLELLRCYRSPATMYSYSDFATPPPVLYDLSGFLRHCRHYLDQVVKEYELEATIVVEEGDPGYQIVHHAESEDVDAVVLCSHGRGGLGRWLLGSVATKVVRGCRKPVFVIKASKGERPEPSLERILICLDGSRVSEEALYRGLEIARAHGSQITLYRTVEFYPYPVNAYQPPQDMQEKHCREYLQQIKERYPDLPIGTEVELGSPAEGILRKAANYNLVVVSSHGYGGFERWLLGSVTEKVLHRCQSPLLVVHGGTVAHEEGEKAARESVAQGT